MSYSTTVTLQISESTTPHILAGRWIQTFEGSLYSTCTFFSCSLLIEEKKIKIFLLNKMLEMTNAGDITVQDETKPSKGNHQFSVRRRIGTPSPPPPFPPNITEGGIFFNDTTPRQQ